ncbi:GSU2403 family nucleotidyltransferase fold protein [Halochromatium roseum]|uniref:GSU2403 family nucleotidyltransferase fold protein n=1 Tax=Halochromatium roseum TaxID=391920 RepID=UPI001914A1C7
MPFRVPDPRAFAFHKAWLSQRMDREPVKKPRDLAQAFAVARLIRDQRPQCSFMQW